MPFVLCYTREGPETYPDHNYPGHTALNCDLYHALHLAISDDGVHYTPLRNNTGILFPDAVYSAGDRKGVTKTLLDPWLFRGPDGIIRLLCVRRNQNAPDPDTLGYIMLYKTKDLVHYTLERYLPVMHGHEIRHPECRFRDGLYHVRFEADGNGYTVESTELYSFFHLLSSPSTGETPAASFNIPGCVPGNVLSITDDEADTLRGCLGRIFHTGTGTAELTVHANASLPDHLPGVTCFYSDDSVHIKPVIWDAKALSSVDTSRPGTWHIPGKVQQKAWPFPIPINFGDDPTLQFLGMSDPCITAYHGRYVLTSTGSQHIHLRIADTPEATFSQPPITICRLPLKPGETFTGTWAAELHEIDGTPYLFTAICPGGEWTRVKACVLRCHGDISNPDDWEAPRLCVQKDGHILEPNGISLDMTWFRDNDRDYVIWSDRIIHYESEPLKADTANLFIATVDPASPWQLTSDPVCLLHPRFGWDRCETEVDEAPCLLRKDDMLYVTFSGSSTAMGDLYTVGLMTAKSGEDLLNPAVWNVVPYPLLTTESAPNQYGPGHNCFITDPETGDDFMVYHAIPHDADDRMMHRQPGIRRVHWTKCGLPCLELTPDEDLNPDLTDTELTLTVI